MRLSLVIHGGIEILHPEISFWDASPGQRRQSPCSLDIGQIVFQERKTVTGLERVEGCYAVLERVAGFVADEWVGDTDPAVLEAWTLFII